MSLQIQNSISPNLARLIVKCRDRRPILEAMGQQLVTITKKAFSDASLRAATWPPRKPSKNDDGHPLLRKTGTLWQSIRITEITDKSVTVASDRPYAARHQLGSADGSTPPRPFFPYLGGVMTALAMKKIEDVATAKARRMIGN